MELSQFQHGGQLPARVAVGIVRTPLALTPSSASTTAITSPVSGSQRLPRVRGGRDVSQPDADSSDAATGDGDCDGDVDVDVDGDGRPKKKQKRNKPTLSCHECVERKTKVRRVFTLILHNPPDSPLPLYLSIHPAPYSNSYTAMHQMPKCDASSSLPVHLSIYMLLLCSSLACTSLHIHLSIFIINIRMCPSPCMFVRVCTRVTTPFLVLLRSHEHQQRLTTSQTLARPIYTLSLSL